MTRTLSLLIVLIFGATESRSISWFEYNGHEYALTESSGNWEVADVEALSNGGYLTAIGSAEEYQFLVNTFAAPTDAPIWIGFTDSQTEGDWNWSNGEAVTYTKWMPGEPNNGLLGEEDHAVMYWRNFETGIEGWNDWYETTALRTFDPKGIMERSVSVPEGASTAFLLGIASSSVALFRCFGRSKFKFRVRP
jgi:hypothetical protein